MLDNINHSEFPEVQMYKVLTESAKLYEPLWGCAHTFIFEHRYKYPERYIFIVMEPVEGMWTKTNVNPETEVADKDKLPRYFVPFKKDSQTYELEDLDWKKAIPIMYGHYARSEQECKGIYRKVIEISNKKLKESFISFHVSPDYDSKYPGDIFSELGDILCEFNGLL